MKNTYTNLQKGFTLIELMVVIAIIGVLTTVTIVAVNPFGQLSKARDTQRKSDLKQLQTALELYNQDKGFYPPALSDINTLPYMQKMPQDPSTKADYKYIVDNTGSTGSGYRIYTLLDNPKDPQICTNGICTNAPDCVGTTKCNYDVTSTNLPR